MNIINEDCMCGLDQMAENSIDLLITDPPYSTPVITAFGRKKFKNLADLSIQEFYFTEMKKKLERTLKPDAPVFFFCDDKFYPILFSAFYDWQNIGLIIWDKNKIGMGKPVRKRHELIFYANQTFRDFKPHGQFTHLPSVLNFKHDSDKIHGAQKPVDLIEMLINGFTNENDTVVDLFGGSGSTGIACDNTKRNGICFELNTEISIASKERGEKRKEKDLQVVTLFGDDAINVLADSDFWVECNVCKTQLKNWTGSTPCCGSIAWLVEDGKPTKKLSLFASVGGEAIKPTVINVGV